MNIVLKQRADRGFGPHFRNSRSWGAQAVLSVSERHTTVIARGGVRSGERYARYQQLRARRRRRGLLWALLAAVTLVCAWDVACRVDDVAYTSRPLTD